MEIEILPPDRESLIRSKLYKTPTGKGILDAVQRSVPGVTIDISMIYPRGDNSPEHQAWYFAAYALGSLRKPGSCNFWARKGLEADISELKKLRAELDVPDVCEIRSLEKPRSPGLIGQFLKRLKALVHNPR